MTAYGFTLFDTAIGRCGIAWSDRGLVGVQLPEAGDRETRERMLQRFPAAAETTPPPNVRLATEGIAALLQGEPSDLSTITLDMEGVAPFHRRVYEAARRIPPGKTLAYGEVAARLGAPGRRARSARHSAITRSRSSCRATACWRRAAKSAAFPPMAAR